ncbi:hypothetical protein AURDEDRAFT_115417 [Auricularia subglabra TFB-10046 SS5]|nr:hypothetical protein AURDEDRAFT_115417 [Auricularia subglabra TFB-10046 SS5]
MGSLSITRPERKMLSRQPAAVFSDIREAEGVPAAAAVGDALRETAMVSSATSEFPSASRPSPAPASTKTTVTRGHATVFGGHQTPPCAQAPTSASTFAPEPMLTPMSAHAPPPEPALANPSAASAPLTRTAAKTLPVPAPQ